MISQEMYINAPSAQITTHFSILPIQLANKLVTSININARLQLSVVTATSLAKLALVQPHAGLAIKTL